MTISKLTLFAFASTLFFSCNNENANKKTIPNADTIKTAATRIVGNDADEHGCKASAGYTFSALKNDCIRVFESGIRMNTKAVGVDTTSSAFIVFKSETEMKNAELFIPNVDKSIILNGEGDKPVSWSNLDYKLIFADNVYSLQNVKSELQYQSEK